VHPHPQRRIGDVRARPHVLPQLGFRHQAAGILHQIAQHRQGLGPQDDALVPLPQAVLRDIKMERPKSEVALLLHGVSNVSA
jgi:hypothetical protein